VLSHTAILKAKPQDKPYKLPREQGLYVLVNPNGSKWWRFAYSFGGKEKLLSLGTFPLVSLGDARQRRDDARKLVAMGEDPSTKRKEAKVTQTLIDDSRFDRVVVAWRDTELNRVSESYRQNVLRMFERDVLPYLGERILTDIKTRDIVKLSTASKRAVSQRRRVERVP